MKKKLYCNRDPRITILAKNSKNLKVEIKVEYSKNYPDSINYIEIIQNNESLIKYQVMYNDNYKYKYKQEINIKHELKNYLFGERYLSSTPENKKLYFEKKRYIFTLIIDSTI